MVPAAYLTLTITVITRDSGTAGGPVVPDWAIGIAWVMAEAVGTGTTKVISTKSIDTQFNPEFTLSLAPNGHFSHAAHLAKIRTLAYAIEHLITINDYRTRDGVKSIFEKHRR